MPFTTGDNNFGVAKWIVNATAGLGTHTTIATALTSSTSGDTIFIMPGTYTENLTLKAGVTLTGFSSSASVTPPVIILGKATLTSGVVAIEDVQLKTNSDFCLVISGSATVNLYRCEIFANGSNAISCDSGIINLYQCNGIDVGGSSSQIFTCINTSTVALIGCYFILTQTTANTFANGTSLSILNSTFQGPITTSNTALFSAYNSTLLHPSSTLTINGTGTSISSGCTFLAGGSSAISIGTGATLTVANCTVDSSNTNAITGAGTLVNAGISFSGTSKTINTTTQTARNFDVGSISINGSANSATKSLMTTINIQTFVASGTYTPTSGMVYCDVEAIGCGGGGGGAAVTGVGQFSTASGGGGGEYARGTFSAATVGASQTVTIGAAGAANSGAAGGAGGNVSLGALLTANGGAGGASSAAGAGQATGGTLGGTGGSGGSIRTPGNAGFGSDSAFAASVIFSGNGGNSRYGSGGIAPGAPGTGGAGLGNGSGGGGSSNLASTSAKLGGVGTVGIIVVTEYISS